MVKELLTDEHKLYHLAYADSNVYRKWDRVIFSDESTFSSANDGLVLIYRPRSERYKSQYMSTGTSSGRVSVLCSGWNAPSYRSPGQPSVKAHFAECNGALCTNALS